MHTPILYCGSGKDYSGYGSANRADVSALFMAGVDVATEVVSHVVDKAKFGWQGNLFEHLSDRKNGHKIKIIHLTPDEYPKYIEKDKYNIGRLIWETDRLPEEWIPHVNKMDEIWTSSDSLAEVFKSCDVRVPVYVFPEPIDITLADKQFDPYMVMAHKGFMFYSIFQWIDRKNPEDLIKTYLKTFEGNDNVSLLIKTHRINFDESEFSHIKEDITRWKQQLNLKKYPRILLCKRLLSDFEMMRLHATGDCYVSADHGEGWGRTIQEALLLGKPLISTARGGIHEYLSPEHYFRVPSTYMSATEQKWIPWYTKKMRWAVPDLDELAKNMLYVYKSRDNAEARGLLAKEFIKDNFSFHTVGQKMKERLEELYKAL